MTEQTSKGKTLNQYLDPYPHFARLRRAGRAVRIRTAFAGEGWVITHHEDAYRLAGDPRLSVETCHAGPELRELLDRFKFRFVDCLPETMIIMDPPRHTRLRRLVAKEFTPRRVASHAHGIAAAVRQLLRDLPADEPVDLVSALAEPLPTAVICQLLGLDQQDADVLQPLVAALAMLPIDQESTRQVDQAREEMWDHLSRMVERKRRHPDDGLLSALIAARDDGDQLSDTELVSMAGLLFAGGSETTTQMIGSGVLLLLRHPDQWDRLVSDPGLIPGAVDELLRFESPVTLGLIRFAAEDITIGDVTIPRGDLVFVGVAPANHDEGRFTNPGVLDVTRQDKAHLAFGRGPHYCLGAPLARTELEIVLSTLLEQYPHMRLACEPADVPWRPSALRGPAALPVWLAPGAGDAL